MKVTYHKMKISSILIHKMFCSVYFPKSVVWKANIVIEQYQKL